LQARTEEILEVAIDRKQLKRSMQRLLKSLQEEVGKSGAPGACDACAVRTGVHSGTNCLSCAQQMKLAARLAVVTTGEPALGGRAPEHEVLASRGGGFMVTAATSAAAAAAAAAAQSYGLTPPATAALVSPRSVRSLAALNLSNTTPSGMAKRPGTSGHSISASGGLSGRLPATRPATVATTSSVREEEHAELDAFPPAPGSLSGASTPLTPTHAAVSGTVTPVLVPLPLRG